MSGETAIDAAVARHLAGQAPVAAIAAATRDAVAAGAEMAAVRALSGWTARPDAPGEAWRLLALALHTAQRHEEALAAAARAAALLPDDANVAALAAQLRLETGRPAAAAFARLAAGRSADPLVAAHANALAADGNGDAAEALLAAACAAAPDWRDGLARLARLRAQLNRAADDAGYAAACAARPNDLALRLDWFQFLAKARRWPAAATVLAGADRLAAGHPALAAARLFLRAEAADATGVPDLFAGAAVLADPGLGLAATRHALRCGRPEAAAAIVAHYLPSPAAAAFWPYASLAWRLLDDPRADWLDRPDRLVQSHDLGLNAAELAALAAVLRGLHRAQAAPVGQSVRGGTQTDQPVLFHHHPAVARARAAIEEAIAAYVAALPPAEPGHPLLGAPRGPIRFAGSWSVRLVAQGFHASHTHPAGWLSSACYVALPDTMGPPPAGALALGTPPPELDLPLQPYRIIPAVAGRLVLFPATTWHGTLPFHDGERLTIAFDIARPRGGG